MKNYFIALLFLFFLVFSAQAHAQSLSGITSFEGRFAPPYGNFAGLNLGMSSDRFTYGGQAGAQMGPYRLSLSYKRIDMNYAEWPKDLTQSSASVGRVFRFSKGKTLIVNVGGGISGEVNSEVYKHIQPTAQVIFVDPPYEEGHWGYMAGVVVTPSSPFGVLPTPFLMGLYNPNDKVKITFGFPMASVNYAPRETDIFDFSVAFYGVQRGSYKHVFTNQLGVSLVYKQERSFFEYISGWESDQLLNYSAEKIGTELEYPITNRLKVGAEGGYLLKRNIEKVERGFDFDKSPLEEKSYHGGSYAQVVGSFQF
jgi:hypothetical protein